MKIQKALLNAVSFASLSLISRVAAQEPLAITVRDRTVITTLHAEGAQVYECKPDTGKSQSGVRALIWQFREPIATLMLDGKSIGQHYAGPSWDLTDGSAVKGKVIASAPGATSNDIPSLELEVVYQHGNGILSAATVVQRTNTKGGIAHGACERAGDYRSAPYSADYVFLRKGG
ncbi:hypothetical protein UP10_14035 [Bradyrhizobium sp. LTSPM299]|uniref:DUF3455 domain-containing protein n=1 Tax=Bradyrhizobium sp. LTSPM299 TaxID=1619233 RepID=UPI0005DE4C44|nr:DUF3455 domain-containing protein [Bradyrhizobium sp. LTSPM299]KJC60195.1 hypothetical protein UP10_14035 [Bradyrhizobium sp. LTSPM299]